MSWPSTPVQAIVSHPTQQSPSSSVVSRKRKKSNGPLSEDEDEAARARAKNQPVKRACNECRQQKLRCDVITEPQLQPCSRCVKHNLHCAIDPGFKRQEKRQQYVELERELQSLRAENAELKAGLPRGLQPTRPSPFSIQPSASSHIPGPSEAAASRSLLDLAQGYDNGTSFIVGAREPSLNTLAKVNLNDHQISELFGIYFSKYHPYLPILSPDLHSTTYFTQSPLLYWTIIAVAARRYHAQPGLLTDLKEPLHELLWSTVANVPQQYHVVKALSLICAWPLPTSSTSLDPSMVICGTMVQLAMQFGLHRPSNAQDFSRTKLELREEEVKDRLNTWVAANIVAQNISTGYGMPQLSRWNWYTHGLYKDRIMPVFQNRCIIERFNDKVTRTLYTMQRDLIVQTDEAHRSLTIDMFARELEEIEATVKAQQPSQMDILHLHVAALHLRLTAFFDSASAPTYRGDLAALYLAATTLLKTFLDLPAGSDSPSRHSIPDPDQRPASLYATNYTMQMVLAAGFTLLKLLNSFFAAQVDSVTGKTLFLQTVSALRSISVVQNDLPQRLAEVLAQLWQASGAGGQRLFDDQGGKRDVDSSLQLKVRCRMSMSLVYDSVWRWKEKFGAIRNLDRMVEHPTQPDATPSIPGSEHESTGLMATSSAMQPLSVADGAGALGMDVWDPNFGANAPFDSLGWALDGFLELPLGSESAFT